MLDALAPLASGSACSTGCWPGSTRGCACAERARGALPPGLLGEPVADSLKQPLSALLGAAKPYTEPEARSIGINLSLPGDRRLTGIGLGDPG